MGDSFDFLDAAAEIGYRLCRAARWQGGSCTWLVADPDAAASPEQPAGPELYSGTSGIGLFLGQLYRATGEADVRRTALGAITHARTEGEALVRSPFSVYAGAVGLAWTLVQLAQLIDTPQLERAGLDYLSPLAGRASADDMLDVIGGAAGAIPVLLQIHARTRDPEARDLAAALGDRLLASARHEPVGWSWGLMHPWVSRNPGGFAHGAAGVGWALLELFAATGAGRYRYAAEQAFLYESTLFVPSRSNWLDVRCMEAMEAADVRYDETTGRPLVVGDRDALLARWQAGLLPLSPRRYQVAWCHGAAGIGLTRVRAVELLGTTGHRWEAREALRATRRDLAGPGRHDYLTLCHGLGGSVELLLHAASVFPGVRFRSIAESVVRRSGRRHLRGTPWPSGGRSGAPSPDLMRGEAGIGHLFLRLHDPHSVPSVVFPRGPGQGPLRTSAAQVREATRLRRACVHEHFGRTIGAFRRLGVLAPSDAPGGGVLRWGQADVRHTFRALQGVTTRLGRQTADLVRDAFSLERQRFLVMARGINVAEGFLRQVLRQPAGAIDWASIQLVRSPHVRLVTTRWNWASRSAPGRTRHGSVAPPTHPRRHALFPHRDRLVELALDEPEWELLQRLRRPRTLDELVVSLRAASLDAPDGPDARRERLIALLRRAWTVGLIQRADVAVPGGGSR